MDDGICCIIFEINCGNFLGGSSIKTKLTDSIRVENVSLLQSLHFAVESINLFVLVIQVLKTFPKAGEYLKSKLLLM